MKSLPPVTPCAKAGVMNIAAVVLDPSPSGGFPYFSRPLRRRDYSCPALLCNKFSLEGELSAASRFGLRLLPSLAAWLRGSQEAEHARCCCEARADHEGDQGLMAGCCEGECDEGRPGGLAKLPRRGLHPSRRSAALDRRRKQHRAI